MRFLILWDNFLRRTAGWLKRTYFKSTHFIAVKFRFLWFLFLRRSAAVKAYSIVHHQIDDSVCLLYLEHQNVVKFIIQDKEFSGSGNYFPIRIEGKKKLKFKVFGYNSFEEFEMPLNPIKVSINPQQLQFVNGYSQLRKRFKTSDTLTAISNAQVDTKNIMFNGKTPVFGTIHLSKDYKLNESQSKTNLEFPYEQQEKETQFFH